MFTQSDMDSNRAVESVIFVLTLVGGVFGAGLF